MPSDAQRAILEQAYPDLGFLPWYDMHISTFQGGPDVILRHSRDRDDVDGNGELSIAARTPEAMNAAMETIGLGER